MQMIWCIHKSRPTAGHKSCRRWYCVPLHFGLLALRGSVESRLEGLEEVTNLIPEILERLGPHTLTPDHQRAVQKYVQHMHELSGRSYGTVYEGLKAAFGVARYADIPDQDWPRVVQWFRVQLEPWRKT